MQIKGGKLYLEDDKGEIIDQPNLIGNLVYEGPNVCKGYAYKREDLSKDDEWRGRLKTGDLAKKDSEGYFFIVGRKKRYAKIFGLSISLDEIEEAIKSNSQYLEVAVLSDDKNIYIILST